MNVRVFFFACRVSMCFCHFMSAKWKQRKTPMGCGCAYFCFYAYFLFCLCGSMSLLAMDAALCFVRIELDELWFWPFSVLAFFFLFWFRLFSVSFDVYVVLPAIIGLFFSAIFINIFFTSMWSLNSSEGFFCFLAQPDVTCFFCSLCKSAFLVQMQLLVSFVIIIILVVVGMIDSRWFHGDSIVACCFSFFLFVRNNVS